MTEIPSLHPTTRARLLDGPLSPHIPAYVSRLKRGRYADTTACRCLSAVAHFARWLGHERPTTTHQYVEADLAMKQRALSKLQEPEVAVRRYRAPDSLMTFLKSL